MIIDEARALVVALLALATSSALSDAYAVVRVTAGQLHRDDVMALQALCRREYRRQAARDDYDGTDTAILNYLGGY